MSFLSLGLRQIIEHDSCCWYCKNYNLMMFYDMKFGNCQNKSYLFIDISIDVAYYSSNL